MPYVRAMSSLAVRAARLFTSAHVAVYRASEGKVAGPAGLGLLTTVGRVSGRQRTTPVQTFPHDDEAYQRKTSRDIPVVILTPSAGRP
jgi:hypothetical protein